MLRDDQGVAPSPQHTAERFQLGAEQDNEEAQFLRSSALLYGHRVPADANTAKTSLAGSCAGGWAEGDCRTGIICAGRGDYTEVGRPVRLAVEQEHAEAMRLVAALMVDGKISGDNETTFGLHTTAAVTRHRMTSSSSAPMEMAARRTPHGPSDVLRLHVRRETRRQ